MTQIEYMRHIESLHNTSTAAPVTQPLPSPNRGGAGGGRKSDRNKQKLDCLCAGEEDLNGHELDPKE